MNIFERHNSLNYFYKKEPGRLSYRLIRYLTCSYEKSYENLYFDVFGRLGDRKFFEMPSYDNTDVLKACIERAKSLPDINLMWSGGVDSTFLLACYRIAGVPVKVYHYDNADNYTSPRLMKYVKNNFDFHLVKSEAEIKKLGTVYLGSLADCFFFSHQRLRGTLKTVTLPVQHGRNTFKHVYCDIPYLPLEDRMRKVVFHEGPFNSRRAFTDEEIMMVSDYSCEFGKPMDTNNRIARFLCFTCSLIKQAFGWSGPFYHGIDSFFLTQKFIDIAYTQYWDCNDKPWFHDKKMFKDFIRQSFGDDFGVEKNFY